MSAGWDQLAYVMAAFAESALLPPTGRPMQLSWQSPDGTITPLTGAIIRVPGRVSSIACAMLQPWLA